MSEELTLRAMFNKYQRGGTGSQYVRNLRRVVMMEALLRNAERLLNAVDEAERLRRFIERALADLDVLERVGQCSVSFTRTELMTALVGFSGESQPSLEQVEGPTWWPCSDWAALHTCDLYDDYYKT